MNTLEEIGKILDRHYAQEPQEESSRIPLMTPGYGKEEILQVMDSLLRCTLTMNVRGSNKIGMFEDKWAKYIGIKNGLMLNSGSSADHLAMAILTNPTIDNPLKPGDEVITPAVTWNSTVSAIQHVGTIPRLVDVNMEDFSIKIEDLEKALNEKTRAIMLVHLLGFPCNMDEIVAFTKKHNLYLIEDCCEAHGAEWKGQKVGSFGDLSLFSFFFSHHMTSIEGGMLLTNNDEYAELGRVLRSQGCMRNMKDKGKQKEFEQQYSEFDPAYLFANLGFNYRPTELQGGFALEQYKKFPAYLEARIRIAATLNERLQKYSDHLLFTGTAEGNVASWLFYPIIIKKNDTFTRGELRAHMESKAVECRAVMSGNFAKQPVNKIFPCEQTGDLPNAQYLHENGFLIGWHPGMKEAHLDYLMDCFDEFFTGIGG